MVVSCPLPYFRFARLLTSLDPPICWVYITLLKMSWIFFFWQLERLLGARIVSAPIDECSRSDKCSDLTSGSAGGCSNSRTVTGEPQLVNTNSTSVVYLAAFVRADCSCAARDFQDQSHDVECRADSCLNGGTCIQQDYSFTWDFLRCLFNRLCHS